jgi:hypothetical protein
MKMKVSVFDLLMKDGSSGKVMVPFIDGSERDKVAGLFVTEGARKACWEHNMWVAEDITKATPVTLKIEVTAEMAATALKMLKI